MILKSFLLISLYSLILSLNAQDHEFILHGDMDLFPGTSASMFEREDGLFLTLNEGDSIFHSSIVYVAKNLEHHVYPIEHPEIPALQFRYAIIIPEWSNAMKIRLLTCSDSLGHFALYLTEYDIENSSLSFHKLVNDPIYRYFSDYCISNDTITFVGFRLSPTPMPSLIQFNRQGTYFLDVEPNDPVYNYYTSITEYDTDHFLVTSYLSEVLKINKQTLDDLTLFYSFDPSDTILESSFPRLQGIRKLNSQTFALSGYVMLDEDQSVTGTRINVDMFIQHLDNNGTKLNTHFFGRKSDTIGSTIYRYPDICYPNTISPGPFGGFYVTGTGNFDPGTSSFYAEDSTYIFAARFNADFSLAWKHWYGNGKNYYNRGNHVLKDGTVVLISQVYDWVDFPGEAYNLHLMFIDPAGELTTLGIPTNPPYNQKTIKIWPNPASDILYLSSTETAQWARIFNLSGQMTAEMPVLENKIDVRFILPGTYLLELASPESRQRFKLVIQ